MSVMFKIGIQFFYLHISLKNILLFSVYPFNFSALFLAHYSLMNFGVRVDEVRSTLYSEFQYLIRSTVLFLSAVNGLTHEPVLVVRLCS